MDCRTGYIAVDWGTTNRRAYLIGGDGALVQKLADDRGVRSVVKGSYPDEVASIRQRLGDLPMLIAGTVGSARGWQAAAYIECPATIEQLASAINWVEPGRSGIIPGVCQRGKEPDVMRGEEVQALGAELSGLAPQTGLICHPGTHAKWIRMEPARIAGFSTAMTGEMFNLLREHSTLSEMLSGKVSDDEAFRAGVWQGLKGTDLLSSLFGIRPRHLLGEPGGQDAAFVSGLLIGCDVRTALQRDRPQHITLVGEPELCSLYRSALELAGCPSRTVPGDTAFLAGISAVVEQLS